MPTFFKTPADFHAWLAEHASTATELIVGFYKRGSGKPSMTWPESVDEALCHGWIDGVRTRIDDDAYQIRFTPRRPSSIWSAVNIEKMRVLDEQGRLTAAGRLAFVHRSEKKSKVYAFEQPEQARLSAEDEAAFREHEVAWRYFESQPPWYRHLAAHRIASARRPETKARRLARLIEACEKSERL